MAFGIATVTGIPAALTYHIPGFVRIDEMRQLNGRDGECEFTFVYDDTKLHEISEVLISSDYYPERPPIVLDHRLGTVHLTDGARWYVYWYARPVPPEYDGVSLMVVADKLDRLNFYVPGFLRIDQFRQLEDDRLELHVIYDPKRTSEIHHLEFKNGGNDPDPTPSPTTLGIVYPRRYGSWYYLRYEDTLVAPAAATN
ncbi:hypothetical protein ACQPW1_47395 [Nocardia sp. CA-128927]|uniref:hypothetical protein n=1 Tax=Nocardia sp. CA-128927 TaxID=3239975 RepID=UPI003D96299E